MLLSTLRPRLLDRKVQADIETLRDLPVVLEQKNLLINLNTLVVLQSKVEKVLQDWKLQNYSPTSTQLMREFSLLTLQIKEQEVVCQMLYLQQAAKLQRAKLAIDRLNQVTSVNNPTYAAAKTETSKEIISTQVIDTLNSELQQMAQSAPVFVGYKHLKDIQQLIELKIDASKVEPFLIKFTADAHSFAQNITAFPFAQTLSQQQTPGQQTPRQQTPGQQTPGQQTPGQQTPGQQTPGQQTPGQQTPGQQTPGQQTPGQQTPGQQTPEEKKQADLLQEANDRAALSESRLQALEAKIQLDLEAKQQAIDAANLAAQQEVERQNQIAEAARLANEEEIARLQAMQDQKDRLTALNIPSKYKPALDACDRRLLYTTDRSMYQTTKMLAACRADCLQDPDFEGCLQRKVITTFVADVGPLDPNEDSIARQGEEMVVDFANKMQKEMVVLDDEIGQLTALAIDVNKDVMTAINANPQMDVAALAVYFPKLETLQATLLSKRKEYADKETQLHNLYKTYEELHTKPLTALAPDKHQIAMIASQQATRNQYFEPSTANPSIMTPVFAHCAPTLHDIEHFTRAERDAHTASCLNNKTTATAWATQKASFVQRTTRKRTEQVTVLAKKVESSLNVLKQARDELIDSFVVWKAQYDQVSVAVAATASLAVRKANFKTQSNLLTQLQQNFIADQTYFLYARFEYIRFQIQLDIELIIPDRLYKDDRYVHCSQAFSKAVKDNTETSIYWTTDSQKLIVDICTENSCSTAEKHNCFNLNVSANADNSNQILALNFLMQAHAITFSDQMPDTVALTQAFAQLTAVRKEVFEQATTQFDVIIADIKSTIQDEMKVGSFDPLSLKYSLRTSLLLSNSMDAFETEINQLSFELQTSAEQLDAKLVAAEKAYDDILLKARKTFEVSAVGTSFKNAFQALYAISKTTPQFRKYENKTATEMFAALINTPQADGRQVETAQQALTAFQKLPVLSSDPTQAQAELAAYEPLVRSKMVKIPNTTIDKNTPEMKAVIGQVEECVSVVTILNSYFDNARHFASLYHLFEESGSLPVADRESLKNADTIENWVSFVAAVVSVEQAFRTLQTLNGELQTKLLSP